MILCHKIFTRIKEGKEICDYFYLFALNVFRRMQSVNALGNKFKKKSQKSVHFC